MRQNMLFEIFRQVHYLCKQGMYSNMCCSHLPSTTYTKSWSGSCLDIALHLCAKNKHLCIYGIQKVFCRSQVNSSLFCCKMPQEFFFG